MLGTSGVGEQYSVVKTMQCYGMGKRSYFKVGQGLVGVRGLVAARKCWILFAHGKGQRTLFQEGQYRSLAK